MADHDLRAFLKALFAGTEGVIEVRLIEEKKGGSVVERAWFTNPGHLLENVERLLAVAESHTAGVFFGVLPRRKSGHGTAADVAGGAVLWNDLDFKNFPGGEVEARASLAGFELQPSILVRSGHGLHAYWLLREIEEPAVLSALSKAIGNVIGGDHTHDAARILRLPQTFNRKDPERPIRVEVEVFEADRRFNTCDVEEAVEALGVAVENVEPQREAEVGPGGFGPLLPEVLARIQTNRRLRALFEGTGKPELGSDGKRLDRSSSGYDFSLALAMAHRGFGADLIANALWNRPDNEARQKGPRYVERTVRRALDRFEQSRRAATEGATDFVVEKVCVHVADHAIHELHIEGHVLRLSSAHLKSRDSFETRFMDKFRRIPQLPDKEEWKDLVNRWLADAEVIEQAPDASDQEALREALEREIENLPVGEVAADLDHGKALMVGEARVFKAETLLHALREDWPGLRRQELCRVLREELGYEHGTERFGDKSPRVWRKV